MGFRQILIFFLKNIAGNKICFTFANPNQGNRPIRLVVRTPGFHPGNRSSILLWATKKVKKIKLDYGKS